MISSKKQKNPGDAEKPYVCPDVMLERAKDLLSNEGVKDKYVL